VPYGGTHSLVEQSLHSRLGAETTNGDGFGLGGYGAPATPGFFRSIEPAWNDQNLRELAARMWVRDSGELMGPGVWNEVPESTWGVVGPDREETQPFRPEAPWTSVPGA